MTFRIVPPQPARHRPLQRTTAAVAGAKLSRRTLIRGVGAALALPWLEAMGPVGRRLFAEEAANDGAAGKPPVRMAVLYMANGVDPHNWTPEGTGADFKLSRTLRPLENLKQELFVLSHLRNRNSNGGDGHYAKTANFLTGEEIAKTTGRGIRSGVSMDQLAAERIGHHTALPSLELGTEEVHRGIDAIVGFTRVYGGHISWRTPTLPLAKELNPRQVFDRLFRPPAKNAADQSLLDLVMEDAHQLHKQVGLDDRRRLDEYLESVRALERRIEFAERENASEKKIALPERPDGIPRSHEEHVRLMLDLMVLAFQTDTTRVSTFMFGNAVSGRDFTFLDGVSGGHHELSHHENHDEKREQYRRINEWHVAQYAYMLDRMRNIQEGEGTLLDNSMILFGSGIRDGNAHSPVNLPILLAGRGGGALQPGKHLAYEGEPPLCNLYRTMLRHMGTPVDQFADSTGELDLS